MDVDETHVSFFRNDDGRNIYCYCWCEHLKNPRALVFICHGVAEHCLWYTPLALMLKNIGCYVFAHDHVGHGQSEGDRVHVHDFHEYVRDLCQHIHIVAEKFPNMPKYIIGHSMGGAIAMIAGLEIPDFFNGIILIAPAITVDPHLATPTKIFLGRIAARICPQLPVIFLDSSFISRDSAVVQRYRDDPLVYHGGLKARWSSSFLQWLQWLESNMKDLSCPLLILHGDQDRMTSVEGSRRLAQIAASKDKTIKIYPGFYHQLHNEPDLDGKRVRQDILEWIECRLI